MTMNVTIHYLVRGAPAPASICLHPGEYFDPLGPGESWDMDGVPRFNHARDYLPPELDIAWTELEAPLSSGVSRVREVFSPDRRVTHWHRCDPDGSEELCVSSQLSPEATHIVRLQRESSEPWRLLFSVVITDLPDGSQSEAVLYGLAQRMRE